MAVNEGTRRIVGGVDTHKDLHVAAVVDEQDRVIGTRSFATTRQGYRQMLAWMRAFGDLQRIGVESTGSYGAGLLRFMQQAGIAVLEVTTPDKQDRRRRGKNDDLDAQNAAHAAFAAAGVAISMDGRGRFMDNIFIERLWRSIKYEEVHLKAYADGREARAGIGSWMAFYNFRRPHQAMNNQTPMAVWRAGMDKIEAAAKSCGYAASLGQRKRVAHIPTAEAEAARSGLILGGQEQARLHLKSTPPRSHQWGPVQKERSREHVLPFCAPSARLDIDDLPLFGGFEWLPRLCGRRGRRQRQRGNFHMQMAG